MRRAPLCEGLSEAFSERLILVIPWYFSVLTPTVLWFREPVAGIHVNHCDEYGTLNPGAAHLPHLAVLGLVEKVIISLLKRARLEMILRLKFVLSFCVCSTAKIYSNFRSLF